MAENLSKFSNSGPRNEEVQQIAQCSPIETAQATHHQTLNTKDGETSLERVRGKSLSYPHLELEN